jgi:hypothetical protein
MFSTQKLIIQQSYFICLSWISKSVAVISNKYSTDGISKATDEKVIIQKNNRKIWIRKFKFNSKNISQSNEKALKTFVPES